MVAFSALNDGEIFMLDEQYHMKTSNSMGTSFAVNLETGILEDAPLESVTETDLQVSDLWE